MNQILITEKLYITPELKKKKKMYKVNLIISIVLITMLFSFYVYAEYDRNKNEDISKDILEGIAIEDDTTIDSSDDVWVIALNGNEEDMYADESNNNSSENNSSNESENNNNESGNSTSDDSENYTSVGTALSSTYTASNGKKYNIVGKINIPAINVNYPILSKTTDDLLKVSVCKFWGSDPNKVGNLCIAGHNYRNKKFFSKVLNLKVGDIIEITDLDNKTLKYKVYDKYTVDPNDTRCTSQITNGKKIVTLITCTNDSKQRVIVQAEQV